MNKKHEHGVFSLFFIGFIITWPAITFSADIYNNLSEAASGNRTIVYQTVEAAASFNTTATDSIIQSITVNIAPYYPVPNGEIAMSIYAADGVGGIPGTLVASSIGVINVTGLPPTPTNYTVSGLNLPLSINTLYWLVLSGPSNAGGVGWFFTSTPNGAPDSLGSTERISGTWGSINPIYLKAKIEANGIPTPTPTPIPTLSEWAQILLALALMGMAGWYWQGRSI